MLELILRHLRNWFVAEINGGTWTVQGGTVDLPFLQPGQYFRIIGSVFNDGVHQYPATGLADETFTGSIWALAIPRALVDTVAEIEEWQTRNGGAAAGPFASESFANYSYTRATDARTGGALTWESAFASRLNVWRKI